MALSSFKPTPVESVPITPFSSPTAPAPTNLGARYGTILPPPPEAQSTSREAPYVKLDQQMAGSVFLNNTTYAGCDIKVVVNIYDGGKGITEQINTLQKELNDAEKEYKRIMTWYETMKLKVSQEVHQATQEFNLYSNYLSSYAYGSIDKQEDLIESLQKQLADLTKKAAAPPTKVLAECQTLSLSTYRDKRPVRACGTVYPKSFTRGPRELAGSLIFTVFDQHVLWDLIQADPSDFDSNTAKAAIIDQLPPVDILVLFANEYGSVSRMAIYGVEFISEGQTMSIEDLLTENAVSFVARDYDPMRKVGSRAKMDETSGQVQKELVMKKASDLLREDDYLEFQKDSPYDRFSRRRNPFL